MDIIWTIRSAIFFVAGLMFLLFPERAYKFSSYLLEKTPILREKYNLERDRKYYPHWGIIFIIISIILFVYSI